MVVVISEREPSGAAFLVVAFATVALLALTEHYVDLLAALVAFTAGGFLFGADKHRNGWE